MNNHDPKEYQKAIYTFKPQELSKLTPWDAQIQLGLIAEKVLAGILRSECLKRVGVKNSPDTHVEYDMLTEQFTVYVPKIWCSVCTNRKAEFEHAGKPYCEDCVELLKEQLKTQEKPLKKGKKRHNS